MTVSFTAVFGVLLGHFWTSWTFFDADYFLKTPRWVRKAKIKQTPKRMRHLIATSDLLCDENNEAISNTNKWSSRKRGFLSWHAILLTSKLTISTIVFFCSGMAILVSSLAMYFGNGFEKFQRYEKQPLVSLAFEIDHVLVYH